MGLRWRLKKFFLPIFVVLITVLLFLPHDTHAVQATNPIKHIVIIVKENHTFDNYFGTYPNANGVNSTLVNRYNLYHLNDTNPDSTFTGLSANWQSAHKAYDNGKMDRFNYLTSSQNTTTPFGYYDHTQIPYYWDYASQFVLFDNFFTSAMSISVPNYQYILSAQMNPDPKFLNNPPYDQQASMDNYTTILNVLDSKNISWKFYHGWLDAPRYFSTLNNTQDRANDVPEGNLFTDISANNLPSVSFTTPSQSEHQPPQDIKLGEDATVSILNAIMTSPYWNSTAVFITWDDYGGWYDHVPPLQVDGFGYGFRAPLLIISPYAKQGFVDHTLGDHSSFLKFIETLYSLPPLTQRDAQASDLTDAFNFTQSPRSPLVLPGIYIPNHYPLQLTSSLNPLTVGESVTLTTVSSSANPSTPSQQVTFTATVNSTTATGTVEFNDTSTTPPTILGIGALSSGTATYSTPSLSSGSHSIVAKYLGDTNNAASTSIAITQYVNQHTNLCQSPPTTGDWVIESECTLGTSTAAQVNVIVPEDVSFTIDSGVTLTINSGLSISNSGTIIIKNSGAIKSGGNITNNSGGSIANSGVISNSGTINNNYGSLITIKIGASIANSGVISNSGTINTNYGGTITNNSGGTITNSATINNSGAIFNSGGTITNSGTISSGGTITNLGTISNSGTISGTGTLNSALSSITNTGTITLKPVPPTITSPTAGSIVMPHVTIAGTAQAGSTVNLSDIHGVSDTTTADATTGVWSFTETLASGADTISVTDTGFGATSSASTVSITVQSAATTILISSSANPSIFGYSITFTATVNSTATTGTVTFYNGTQTLSTGTLSGGTATYSTSAFAPGSYSITASYSGDTNYLPSTSGAITQTVNAPATATITLVSSVNPSTLGQQVTFTATVNSATATGTVTFYNGTQILGTGTLSGGTATYSTSAFAPGSYSITASYSGDTNYLASTSDAITQNVNQSTNSCQSPPSTGNWIIGSSCTLATSTTPQVNVIVSAGITFTINSGQTLTINSGISISNSGTIKSTGTISNLGTLNNYGTIKNTGILSNSGTITSSGTISNTGTISNSGILNNSGYIGNGGTITNNSGGTITNSGTISSYGTINNSGTITNTSKGKIINYSGGKINNNSGGTITKNSSGTITNSATITNSGTINSGGAITNSGTIKNSGTISGTGTISSALSLITNTGIITLKPVAPTITSPTAGSTVISHVSISGTAPAGSTVNLSDIHGVSNTTTAGATTGAWSFTETLASGAGTISVTDTSFGATSSASTVSITVQATTGVTLISSANPSVFGDSVTFTATVNSATATGTVTFYNGTQILGTGTLSGGTATYSTSAFAPGSYSITASYSGDTNYLPSTSGAITQTVNGQS